MAIIKCKMCGGDVHLAEDKTFGTCEYCGSTMTFPKVTDEQRTAAFNRGNHFRRIGEFDKALAVYERIVAEDDTDAEAHWCCALCRFGIEYVEDPATYEWLPTCHRASFDSFLEDVDYLAAVEHSEGITRRQYQKDAAKIAEVQRGILATSQNAEPYDVFISYKELDEQGERTRDSILAQEIYYRLTEKGWRVFFSRISLEDVPGTQYEPYIFAALNSAKVMVVVGTSAENFSAVWVKNEWSRFLSLMRKDRTKLLIPCYRDMDPYDLPEQLAVLMSYDMGKIGFIQDLIRGVDKVLNADKPQEAPVPAPVQERVIVQQSGGGPNVTALLKRGQQALEDGDWDKARDFYDQVLSMDAENAEAFFGLFLAGAKCADEDTYIRRAVEQIGRTETLNISPASDRIEAAIKANTVPGYLPADEIRKLFAFDLSYPSTASGQASIAQKEKAKFESNRNLNRAFRFAKDELKARLERFRSTLFSELDSIVEKANQRESADKDERIGAYEAHLTAAEQKIVELHKIAEEKIEAAYQSACKEQEKAKTAAEYLNAIGMLLEVEGYRDTDERITQCRTAIEDLKEHERIRKEAEAKAAAEEAERQRKAAAEEAERQRKAAAEEAERQRIEREKADTAARKKRKITTVIISSVLLACAVLAIVFVTVIIPKQKLNEAMELLDSGHYEAAYALLEEIGNSDAIASSKYDRAVALLDSGDYEAAYTLLEEIGNSDAIASSKYDRAVALLDSGDYEAAYTLLEEIGNSDAIASSKYDRAVALLDSGDYEAAYTLLEEIGNSEAIAASKYDRAVALMDSGDYVTAYYLLDGLAYQDSAIKQKMIEDSDAWIRICPVGGTIFFGSYEQDKNFTNGKENIEWLVLAKEGHKLLVISKYALDCQQYNTTNNDVTWETSSLREWLNSTFINTAFTNEEKNMIPRVTVVADKNPYYDTSPGNNTRDYIFLLSVPEVEQFFGADEDRKCVPSAVIKGKGYYAECSEETCWWWLRTPGINSTSAALVFCDGRIFNNSNYVYDCFGAVRPAMWIEIRD